MKCILTLLVHKAVLRKHGVNGRTYFVIVAIKKKKTLHRESIQSNQVSCKFFKIKSNSSNVFLRSKWLAFFSLFLRAARERSSQTRVASGIKQEFDWANELKAKQFTYKVHWLMVPPNVVGSSCRSICCATLWHANFTSLCLCYFRTWNVDYSVRFQGTTNQLRF